VGPITVHYEALALRGDSDQTLFIYTTELDSPSQQNLRLLASWSTDQPTARRTTSDSVADDQPQATPSQQSK
jgi:hypothetical protein